MGRSPVVTLPVLALGLVVAATVVGLVDAVRVGPNRLLAAARDGVDRSCLADAHAGHVHRRG